MSYIDSLLLCSANLIYFWSTEHLNLPQSVVLFPNHFCFTHVSLTYLIPIFWLDINECAKNTTLCAPGECMNKNGGYVCDCPEGFQANAQKTECIGEWSLISYRVKPMSYRMHSNENGKIKSSIFLLALITNSNIIFLKVILENLFIGKKGFIYFCTLVS